MLNGQKLQGVQTAKEVHRTSPSSPSSAWTRTDRLSSPRAEFLKARGKVEDYPLFTAVVRSPHSPVS